MKNKPKPGEKPTVKDVARRAGVSPSTVSRVISNNPRISQATRDKVLKEMQVLEYQPNAIARSLARSRTKILGIVMPTRQEDVLMNPFFPEALRGIVMAAAVSGYDVLLSANLKTREELDVIRDFIGGGKVDGLILMGARENDPNIQYLMAQDFPFSLIGSASKRSINHVDNDNVAAARELTKHILSTGKRNLCFVSGPLELTVTRDRLQGFREALAEAGITPKDHQIFTGEFNEATGAKIAGRIVENGSRPDAVVATDDVIAYGMFGTLTGLGYRIPEDIAIGSFNNSILARYTDAQLTSIDIKAFKLGQQSVRQLQEAIEGGLRDSQEIIGHELIKRRSTVG